MALNTIADLSTIVASNVDVIGQPTLGSADANQLDAVDRSTLALLARFYGDIGGLGSVGGSANAITLTSLSTYQALESGLMVSIKASAANTTAATLNLDGNGAKAIRLKGDVALAAGEIAANGRYDLVYDEAYNAAAGAWVLKNPETQRLDADLTAVSDTGISAFSGLLYGLTLSNGTDATNDIDIAAGVALDSTNAKFIKLAAGITKRLDAAWAVGTGNGGLDTGSIANTTYHMWLILRSDTGVVDVLFSASATSPTMPANYDYKRRIGSIVRTGAAIKAFIQVGDKFYWVTRAADILANNPGVAAVTATLTVPTGIIVNAQISAGVGDSGGASRRLLVSALNQADLDPGSSRNNITAVVEGNANAATSFDVFTNTSGQVRYRLNSSTAATDVIISTIGWEDTRGR